MDVIDTEKLINNIIKILHDDVCAPGGHLDPYYMFKTIKDMPAVQPEPPANGSVSCISAEKMHDRTTDDLISRQAAIDACLKGKADGLPATNVACDCCAERIRVLPSAQPERKTGHWDITDAWPHNVYCSECHKKFAQTHWAVWMDGSLPRNFCPNCGADMGGVNNGQNG